MTANPPSKGARLVAWLLALGAALAFTASITGNGDGPAGIDRLQHWAWAWLAALLLVAAWAALLAKGGRRRSSAPLASRPRDEVQG